MLQEDPAVLVQSSIESFEIQPDILTLDRIHKNIETIQQNRNKSIENLQAINSELTNQINLLTIDLDNLLKVSNYPELEDTSDKDISLYITNKLDDLKNLRVSISKNLSDLNVLISSNNRTKLKLIETINTLNASFNDLLNENLTKYNNSNVMKIHFFKHFGVRIEMNETETGNDKIIVVNEKTSNTFFFKVEDHYNDCFISDKIWEYL